MENGVLGLQQKYGKFEGLLDFKERLCFEIIGIEFKISSIWGVKFINRWLMILDKKF
jgi:hypothetical protein